MERVVQQSVLQAAKVLEDQVDAELERMERLDEDDIERLREKRLQQVRLFLSTHGTCTRVGVHVVCHVPFHLLR